MIKQQKKEVIGIFKRLKNRDFSGSTGIAVKNSGYGLATTVVAKIGSLLFTIIVARILMPELFGLYSLALSTIVFFAAFADLGIGTALIKYISAELGKKSGNPGKYYYYFLNLKVIISLLVSLAIILLAYPISHYYYNKPIFFALMAGGAYLFLTTMLSFYSSLFQAYNNFRQFFMKEIVFQFFRLALVPLTILIFLSNSAEFLLFSIIISLSVAYAFSLIYLFLKKPNLKKEDILPNEKRKVFLFILPITTTIFSGIFFGYIDMIILGRFVESAFIGYYQAALALVSSAGAFVGCTAGALFPLFSRLKGKKLRILFAKSLKYTSLLSVGGIICTILFAHIIVNLVYGADYSNSIFLLRISSILLFLDPIIGIYSSFYISQNKPKRLAKILVFSTILNIVLNYLFISILVTQSHYMAIIGATIATILTKVVYLGLLVFFLYTKKDKTF